MKVPMAATANMTGRGVGADTEVEVPARGPVFAVSLSGAGSALPCPGSLKLASTARREPFWGGSRSASRRRERDQITREQRVRRHPVPGAAAVDRQGERLGRHLVERLEGALPLKDRGRLEQQYHEDCREATRSDTGGHGRGHRRASADAQSSRASSDKTFRGEESSDRQKQNFAGDTPSEAVRLHHLSRP